MTRTELANISVEPQHIKRVIAKLEQQMAANVENKGDKIFISPHEVRGAILKEVTEFSNAQLFFGDEEVNDELKDIACVAIFALASELAKTEYNPTDKSGVWAS